MSTGEEVKTEQKELSKEEVMEIAEKRAAETKKIVGDKTQEEINKLTRPELNKEMADQSLAIFYDKIRIIKHHSGNVSKKGIVRSLLAACHESITNVQHKLIGDDEKKLAIAVYELLQHRLIIQAYIANEIDSKEQEETNNISEEETNNE